MKVIWLVWSRWTSESPYSESLHLAVQEVHRSSSCRLGLDPQSPLAAHLSPGILLVLVRVQPPVGLEESPDDCAIAPLPGLDRLEFPRDGLNETVNQMHLAELSLVLLAFRRKPRKDHDDACPVIRSRLDGVEKLPATMTACSRHPKSVCVNLSAPLRRLMAWMRQNQGWDNQLNCTKASVVSGAHDGASSA